MDVHDCGDAVRGNPRRGRGVGKCKRLRSQKLDQLDLHGDTFVRRCEKDFFFGEVDVALSSTSSMYPSTAQRHSMQRHVEHRSSNDADPQLPLEIFTTIRHLCWNEHISRYLLLFWNVAPSAEVRRSRACPVVVRCKSADDCA